MINLRKMCYDDIKHIFEWNEESEEFLKQWSNFTYPLTEQQFKERIDSNEYDVLVIEEDKMPVGTIQIFKFDREKKAARVGCYLIKPETRNKGIGCEALKAVVNYAFNNEGLLSLNLGVFDFNKSAQKCYEKAGFVKTNEYVGARGWKAYTMEIHK